MYEVSAAYKAAMQEPIQERDLRGSIGNLPFTARDIIAGSFSVSNSAMDSTDIKYGSVYIGEVNMSVLPSFPVSRRGWRGLTVEPEIGMKVNGTYEYVPVGVFTITKVNWSQAAVQITAYDNMMWFDRSFPGREEYNKMTAYGFLSTACRICGVALGNTQAEIEAMPNGTQIFNIYEENNLETWRDVISVVAQALGAFATIDRAGALVIRRFGTDTGLSLDATQRFVGAVMSDYITHYTGVGVVLTAQNKYYYRAAQTDDGESMKLGENPLLQYVLKAELDARLDEILEELETFEYTPYTVSMLGDIAYDLGDVVTFTDGVAATGGDRCCIMAYEYTYGRGFTSEGYGDDPELADARSKVTKSLDGIRDTQVQHAKDIEELKESALLYLWPNATSDDPIADGEESVVAEWTIQCAEGAEIGLMATLGFTIETTAEHDVYKDAAVTITLKVGDETEEVLTETYGDGEHVLAISHLLKMEVGGIYTITLEVAIAGGDLS